jgi:hypothetical protein
MISRDPALANIANSISSINDNVGLINDSMGLVLVKYQAIDTGVSTVSVTNAFSSQFDNYKIIISGVSFTGGGLGYYYIKFNNSSGSTYNYTDNAIENMFGSAMYTYANATSDGILIAQAPTTGVGSMVLDIVNPFLSARTTVSSQYSTFDIGSTSIGIDTNSASHTDFTISGGFTGGTIRVYGFKNLN